MAIGSRKKIRLFIVQKLFHARLRLEVEAGGLLLKIRVVEQPTLPRYCRTNKVVTEHVGEALWPVIYLREDGYD